jgi:hypothetical protein
LDLGGPGADADGQEENEGDFQAMVEGMMSQLMSKEILYDPLKELNEKVSIRDYAKMATPHSGTTHPSSLRIYRRTKPPSRLKTRLASQLNCQKFAKSSLYSIGPIIKTTTQHNRRKFSI